MSNLTIIANIIAKSDKTEFVKAELEKLVDIIRSDESCLQFDLHQDNENSAHFLFYENWESRELWRKHMDNAHLAQYMKATEGAVDTFTLNEMSHIA